MTTYTDGTGVLYTEDQKSSILSQLDRLLENSHFSHSKRFPSFLRFIVREELEGRGDQLKERTLGMEVFGRDAGYDTTSDPIVRVTAAEIRKRIAQYYQEAGHTQELRISLPPGSYLPHFAWPQEENTVSHTPEVRLLSLPMESAQGLVPELAKPKKEFRTAWKLGMSALALLIFSIGGLIWARSRPTALDRFWAPVLEVGESVVVCYPRSQVDHLTLRSAALPETVQVFQEQASAVLVDDLQPLVSLSSLMDMRHQRYTLMGSDTATLTDLRHGPAVFLGAFDNAWTLRVTQSLRFRFGNDPEMKHFWIEDTQGNHTHWQIDRSLQVATNNYRDYAVVARFVDSSTGQVAVVLAGIARGGTVAAGEFLTQPGNMEAIKSRAPKGWAGQNMEFVLSTEIIDGRSAPPKIEATYFW